MHPAILHEQDFLRGLIPQLASARHGEKGTLIQRAADYLQISRPQVFRRLAALGYDSGRKPRADRGSSKVSKDELRQVAGLLLESTRANGKRLMSMELAIDIARANGLLQVEISPSRLSELLQQHSMHPDQLSAPTPHVQLASLHPNHVWQIDASVCVLYYLKNGAMQVMEQEEFYKNKPQNIVKVSDFRVIRYVLTDHYSGAFNAHYYMGSESTENLTAFFLRSIQKRPDDPFHGVPLILSMDAGAAGTAGLFLNLLERLDVQQITHLPGNARAKGQVEVTNNIVERQFESRLAFMRVESLEQLNALCHDWRLAFHSEREHTRHGRTRFAMWTTIREEQLRLPPPIEMCRELVTTRPVPATVQGNLRVRYTISAYGSLEYDVSRIAGLMPRSKVEIVVNPYRAPDVDIHVRDAQGVLTVYTVAPVKKNLAGFMEGAPVIGQRFAAQPDTDADTARKAIRKDAYGVAVDGDRDVRKLRKGGAVPYEGTVDPMADVKQAEIPTWMPKRGTEMEVAAVDRELPPLSHVGAAKELKARGVAWEPRFMRLLEERWPDGNVPHVALDDLVAELSSDRGLQRVVQGVRHA